MSIILRLTQGDGRHADAQEPSTPPGPGAVPRARHSRPQQAAAGRRRRRAPGQAARLHARWQKVAHC